MRNKKIIFVIGCILFLEVMAKAYCLLAGDPLENKYGWYNPINESITRTVIDRENYQRNITVTYFDHGFKRWGNINSDKKKVLIIGDNFTNMPFVNNGEEYYAYLEKKFKDIEFFVFGAGGFSSLQEYLVLDDFIDKIKPDIILWQFCISDYADNLYDYNVSEMVMSKPVKMPFFENDKIEYRYPSKFSKMREVSELFNLTYSLYIRYRRHYMPYSEFISTMKKNRDNTPSFIKERAVDATINIIDMAKKRAGQIPFYFFSAFPITDDERKICVSTNINCIDGVGEIIAEKEKEGYTVHSLRDGVPDFHWNYIANKFAGEVLVNYFEKNNIL